MDLNFFQQNVWVLALIVIWELVWKGLALWKAAKRDQKYWFIALLIINSVGILPIIYLSIRRKDYETKFKD